MIESIYSNEGGEENRMNKVPVTFKMPKNIRQVGKSSAHKKVYVEDYVMTYIRQISGEEYQRCKVAVLLGQYVKMDNCRNIFIYGAIEVESIDTSSDIVFTNEAWTNIYESIKKYFVDAEIVGWFIGGPGYLLEEEEKILKTHIDNFAGQDKTLLTYDNLEKEETFLIYENNRLCKQEGYYIYYERNEEMQTYMIDHKRTNSEEVTYDDRVSREIRTIIQKKKPEVNEEDTKSVSKLMYAAGTLMAVIVLVVAAAMLDNYGQMRSMKETINNLSQNILNIESSEQPADKVIPTTSNVSEGSLNVEYVPGNVEPLEEATKEEQKGKENQKEDQKEDQKKDQHDKKAEKKDDTEKPKENNTQSEKVTAAPKANEAKETKAEVKYYTVQYGDTLAGISYKLYNSGTYAAKIKQLNNIENGDLIYEGQKLIVP